MLYRYSDIVIFSIVINYNDLGTVVIIRIRNQKNKYIVT